MKSCANTSAAICRQIYDQGILFTEEYGVGAPSSPNYIAPASGDDFGVNSDSDIYIAQNVSTVADILEAGGISWSDYSESMPYSGYDGYAYNNTVPGVDYGPYMKKHNLLQRFESVSLNETREQLLKNFTL